MSASNLCSANLLDQCHLTVPFSASLAPSRASNETCKLSGLECWFESSPSSYLIFTMSRSSYFERYSMFLAKKSKTSHGSFHRGSRRVYSDTANPMHASSHTAAAFSHLYHFSSIPRRHASELHHSTQ